MDAVIPHTSMEINSHCLTAYKEGHFSSAADFEGAQMNDEKLV